MKISKSKLRQLIRSEITSKSVVTERTDRGRADDGGGPGATSGAGEALGPQSGASADVKEWELQPANANDVISPQTITIAAGSAPDVDLNGVADVDKFHDFIKAMISTEVIGDGGSFEFYPWQSWQAAGRGRTRTINFTLVNNVTPRTRIGPGRRSFANPSALGVIIKPTKFNMRTESPSASGEGGSGGSSSTGLTDGIKGSITRGVQAMAVASEPPGALAWGTNKKDFDDGLKLVINSANRAGDEKDAAKAFADSEMAKTNVYDTVAAAISGEWSFGPFTKRRDAWNNLSTAGVSWSTANESVERGEILSSLSPAEVWNWLNEDDEAAETPAQAEDIDLTDVSTEAYQAYVDRVEAVLARFPEIGWSVTDPDAKIPTGVNEISYFFIKEYGNSEAEAALHRSSSNALKRHNKTLKGEAGASEEEQARLRHDGAEEGGEIEVARTEREEQRSEERRTARAPEYGGGRSAVSESRLRELVRDGLILVEGKKKEI